MVPLFSSAPGKWTGSDQKMEEGDKWRVKMERHWETEEDESQPSINLDLGIGGPSTSSSEHHLRLKNKPYTPGRRSVKVEQYDHDHDQVVLVDEREGEKQRSRKRSVVCFTEEQLEEFKTQLVIYKYMVSGLPVPLQLLLPIWRCFPSFLSPLYCDLSRRNPFLLGLSCCSFNNIYLMDPEPGRCKRTDGKKWRCHLAVIPNQKYCEKHMHRGSKRSRKLVEGSTRANLSPGTPSLMNTNPNNIPSNELKVKFPANVDNKPELSTHKNPMSGCSRVVGGSGEAKECPAKVLVRVPSVNNSAKINENDEQKNSANHNYIMNDRIAAINLSSGLGFSPISVLQSGQKCPQLENLNDSNAELGRCRRTDGKKWRCYKSVLPDQKYCAHHINRGMKRAAAALSASGDAASDIKLLGLEQATMNKFPNAIRNVSLTISSGDPKHITPEDSVVHNCESGSTSETTITDDSADDISNKIVVSP